MVARAQLLQAVRRVQVVRRRGQRRRADPVPLHAVLLLGRLPAVRWIPVDETESRTVSHSPTIQARNISSNSIISTHVTVHGLNAHANVAHPIIILQPIPIRYPCFITHATCELSSTATVHGVKWLRLLSIQPSSDQDHNSKLLPAKREILSRTDGLPGGEGVSPLVVAEVRVVAREHEPDMPVLLESEHQY
jgi:hypothetical protein